LLHRVLVESPTNKAVSLCVHGSKMWSTLKLRLRLAHSVALFSPEADYFVRDHYLARTPCGAGTPFFRLLERKGEVSLLGVRVSTVTFFHCVEELIEDELPFSPFTSEVFTMRCSADGKIVETAAMGLYDPGFSGRRNLSILESALPRKGAWHQRKLGSLRLTLLNADIVSTKDLAKRGICCYRKAKA
jgi:aminoglycoside N3'-acetyltransferase